MFYTAISTPHEKRDGDGRAGTRAENLTALLSRQFSACTLIAAKVEHVDGIELFLQSLTEAVHRACVKPSGVGDERDDSFAALQPIRRPAERLDVAVVKSFLEIRF